MDNAIKNRIANWDWNSISAELSASGFGLTGSVLTAEECEELVSLYEDETRFRSKIVMERFRFGKGDYKYFRYPLPEIVQQLREFTYPRLAKIANEWRTALSDKGPKFAATHEEFLNRCRRAGQNLPTPLMLHYEAGGYNCLHQDIYGDIAFPLQLVVMLGQQGRDWDGGEFVLVENVPRAQSRAQVITADQGHGIVFTTRYRPAKSARGFFRLTLRHGVSPVRRGTRSRLNLPRMSLSSARGFLASAPQALLSFSACCFRRGLVQRRMSAPSRGSPCLARKRGLRSARSAFFLQGILSGARTPWRDCSTSRTSLRQVSLRLFPHAIRRTACLGRRQLYASAACFRQSDCNRLLRRPCPMLSLAHMMHLFAYKFSRLC
jgi:hypothetical protein